MVKARRSASRIAVSRLAALGLPALGLAAAVGCPKPTPALKPAPAIELLVSGCGFDGDDGVCHATSATISVWAAPVEAGPELSVETEGLRLHETVRLDRGTRYTLTQTSTSQTGRLVVRARHPGHAVGSETVEVRPSCKTGCWPEEATRLAAEASRLTRAGEYAPAVEAATKAAEMLRAAGSRSEAIRLGCLAAFGALRLGKVRGALAHLELLPRPISFDAKAQHLLLYHRAIASREAGRPRDAIDHLSTTELINQRVGAGRFLRSTLQVRLALEARSGANEATSIEKRLLELAVGEENCGAAASILTNVTWSRLIANERKTFTAPNAESASVVGLAEIALEKAARCAPQIEPVARLNLAHAHLLAGDFAASYQSLNSLEGTSGWRAAGPQAVRLLKARALMGLRRFNEAVELLSAPSANLTPDQDIETQAWFALATLSAGNGDAGLELLQAASHELRSLGVLVSLIPSSRSIAALEQLIWRWEATLALDRRDPKAFETLLRQLRAYYSLRRGSRQRPLTTENNEAYLAAASEFQTARARFESLRANAWSLSSSQLTLRRTEIAKEKRLMKSALDRLLRLSRSVQPLEPAIGPTTNQLLIIPGVRRWHAMLRQPHRTRSVSTVSTALESGIAELLHVDGIKNETLGIAAHPSLLTFDFASIELGSGQLIDFFTVSFGLQAPQGVDPNGKRAVVLYGSGAGLAAHEEAEEVADALRTAGYSVKEISPNQATDAQGLLSEIEKSDYFHFAGHAQTGPDTTDSVLRVRDNLHVSIADLMTMERAPRWVVLSACETASSGTESHGFGLAHAFLALGSTEVVASTRRVRGQLARAVGSSLASGHGSLSERLRNLQLRMRDSSNAEDLFAFRSHTHLYYSGSSADRSGHGSVAR